tara:strand:- start:330 stop:755 length:426 start_codon:yes stop_codon:yes gene_type:complete
MCFGGGSSQPAIINVPSYPDYDDSFDLRKDAIDQAMNNQMLLAQQQLQTTLSGKNDLLMQMAMMQRQEADDININFSPPQQEAMKMAQVIGPPPREEYAKAPEIGVNERGIKGKKGKKSLRIRRETNANASNASGTGLNIT